MQDFHAYFAALFGRRETRDHSRHYLQALLVLSGERRNAENLSETVPASARAMQRFLTESPWDDDDGWYVRIGNQVVGKALGK